MNRIATNLIVAAGLAVGTLTFSATAAHAETPPAPKPGPVLALPTPGPSDPIGPFDASPADPKPPKPTKPKGPKDLGVVPPKPVIDPKPEAPTEPTKPVEAAPTADQGCFEGCDLPELPLPDAAAPEVQQVPDVADVDTTGATQAPTTASTDVQGADDSHELLWIIAGAGLGLGGLVLVARRRRQAEEA